MVPRKTTQVRPATLYALSDSTANLVRHMLTAFLTQFPPDALHVRYEPFVQSVEDVSRVFERITGEPGAVVHAVVAPKIKKAVRDRCGRLELACHDLTGPAVAFLAKAAGVNPLMDHGGLHRVDEAYERRIEAMEYTLNHDDGLGLQTLGEAAVVLAGVSRVSKTPTSILLAHQGLKAANVALAMVVEPPRELLAMPREKVIGLHIDPVRLAEIRSQRQGAWNMPTTSYNELRDVREEVAWSRKLFTKMGWRTIDITGQAVEETAAKILQMIESR